MDNPSADVDRIMAKSISSCKCCRDLADVGNIFERFHRLNYGLSLSGGPLHKFSATLELFGDFIVAHGICRAALREFRPARKNFPALQVDSQDAGHLVES